MKNLSKYMIASAIACLTVGGTVVAADKADWGNFKLWIDPGHSGHENSGLYGYTEAQKVLRVGLATKEYLQQYTTIDTNTVRMTRYTDNEIVDLDERSDMANAWGADFFYSIHSDAGSGQNQTLFLFGGWKKDGQYIEKTPNGGKRYGEFLDPSLTGVMYNTTSRGNYYDRVYYNGDIDTHENQYPYLSVNRRTNMASLLSEGGFHTHKVQQPLNMNDNYKRLEAFGTFRAIMQYRGLQLPEKVLLAGVVKNSENDQPIDNVTVTVDGKTYVTDSYESLFKNYTKNPNLIHNGFFLFEDLTPGKEYTVTYSCPGYTSASKTVTLNSNPQGQSSENVTWANMELTSNAPAVVSSNSITDPAAVNILNDMVITFSRKMDKASVEKAFSISNNGKVTLTWENDYTLHVSLKGLLDDMDYTITIDGSVAKNSQTNQFFDGDGDGQEGGNYVFAFTTIPADVEAPYVKSTTPAENSTMLYTHRPVIRVEYNEELAWNDDDATDAIIVEDKDGNRYSGKLTHAVVRNASVLHLYLNEDLPLDKCFKVTVKGGFKDLSGNVSEGKVFKFLSEYRTVKDETVIDDTTNPNLWFTPAGSGSSKGFTAAEDQSMTTNSLVSNSNQTSSFKVHYEFEPDPATGTPYWGLRIYKKDGVKYYTNGKNAIIQYDVYGDGSNNYAGIGVRDRSDAASVKRYTKKQLDFRGWDVVAWDVNNDSCDIVSGEKKLVEGLWMFDAVWLWKGYLEDFEDDDADNPRAAWTGDFYFDNLKYVHYNNEEQKATLDDIIITGVDEIAESAITVKATANAIKVNAPEAITSVEVFAMNGMQVAALAPQATSATVGTAGLAAGVYVVKVTTANKNLAQRVIIK